MYKKKICSLKPSQKCLINALTKQQFKCPTCRLQRRLRDSKSHSDNYVTEKGGRQIHAIPRAALKTIVRSTYCRRGGAQIQAMTEHRFLLAPKFFLPLQTG